jgi:hypothetical protein
MSTVNLSKQTLKVLENFATINASIIFKQGNVIKTISNAENILGEYVCEEYFPRDFAIYDLSQFLAGISILDAPTLVFDNDDYVTLKGKNASLKYYFSDPQITLKAAPEKEVKFPGTNIEFHMNNDLLKKASALSDKFKLQDISFCSKDSEVYIECVDREMDTSNKCRFDLPNGTSTGDTFLNMKFENLKVNPHASYKVEVSEGLLSRWTVTDWAPYKDINLRYYVALEPK